MTLRQRAEEIVREWPFTTPRIEVPLVDLIELALREQVEACAKMCEVFASDGLADGFGSLGANGARACWFCACAIRQLAEPEEKETK